MILLYKLFFVSLIIHLKQLIILAFINKLMISSINQCYLHVKLDFSLHSVYSCHCFCSYYSYSYSHYYLFDFRTSEDWLHRLVRPWLWNDLVYFMSPRGKAQKKNLKILHDFTDFVCSIHTQMNFFLLFLICFIYFF